MITEAVMLAGGFGTRLQTVVSDVPKPMAPINGKPFLTYVLHYLKEYGIRHIVLSVGHLHEVVKDYFGLEWEGLKISYAIENEPLGTGGAIKFAFEKILGNQAFVVNGDTLFDVDLAKLSASHNKSKAEISIALRRVKEVSRDGSVQNDTKNKIIGFTEKGTQSGVGNINGGIYMINKQVFKKISIFTEKFSMENDVFEKYYNALPFFGFPFEAYFIDIGVPEDYQRANLEL